MAVRLVVGITDRDWFEHLRARPNLGGAIFWSPSPRPFRPLAPGELFLVKLKAPVDRIVGGVFAHAAESRATAAGSTPAATSRSAAAC